MQYRKASKRISIRGQNKLIREAQSASLLLRRTQASFDTARYLLRSIKKLQRIESSLTVGKYISGAIDSEKE